MQATLPYNTKAALHDQSPTKHKRSSILSTFPIFNPAEFWPRLRLRLRAQPNQLKDIFVDIFSQTISSHKPPALLLCFCKTS
jgi:hypothetical protein